MKHVTSLEDIPKGEHYVIIEIKKRAARDLKDKFIGGSGKTPPLVGGDESEP
jgi:hypothetical protein